MRSRRQVEQVHGGCGPGLRRGILACQVPIPTSRTRLRLLALDPCLCAGLAGVGNPAGAGRRIDTSPLSPVVVLVVVGAMSLQKIGATKGLSADLHIKSALNCNAQG